MRGLASPVGESFLPRVRISPYPLRKKPLVRAFGVKKANHLSVMPLFYHANPRSRFAFPIFSGWRE